MTIREVGRRMKRDVKGVHYDVHSLLVAGLLRKTENGKVVFPFDEIHVDFTVRAA
jgi:predicted transcriptional regulator